MVAKVNEDYKFNVIVLFQNEFKYREGLSMKLGEVKFQVLSGLDQLIVNYH